MKTKRDAKDVALPAGEFERIFQKANVLTDVLANAKNKKSKSTQMGKFLSHYVGREVPIDVKGRAGRAKLCMTQGRSKQKLYYFEVRWDDSIAEETAVSAARADHDDEVEPPVESVTESESQTTDLTLGETSLPINHDGNDEQW